MKKHKEQKKKIAEKIEGNDTTRQNLEQKNRRKQKNKTKQKKNLEPIRIASRFQLSRERAHMALQRLQQQRRQKRQLGGGQAGKY